MESASVFFFLLFRNTAILVARQSDLGPEVDAGVPCQGGTVVT
jgi:hypothetical protein